MRWGAPGAAAASRFCAGSATWSGSLHDGKGAVSTESQAMKNHPYTFFSRYGETPATIPAFTKAAIAAPFLPRNAHTVPRIAKYPVTAMSNHAWTLGEMDIDGLDALLPAL